MMFSLSLSLSLSRAFAGSGHSDRAVISVPVTAIDDS